MDTSGEAGPAAAIVRALGTAPIARTAAWVTRRRLRILAYHDVPDAAAFEAQVAELARGWRPVTGTDVAEAISGGRPLPDRAVWLTFDDGLPSVVDAGLPVLEAHGVPATWFVCPGVIDSGQPHWWQVIEARPDASVDVGGRSLSGRPLVRALKEVDDAERRLALAEVAGRAPTGPVPAILTRDRLDRWVASGREVGNHTWDHPILERCSEAEQTDQLVRAHEWLSAALPEPPRLFAYPNGDHTPHAADDLARLGYRATPLFDHHLVGRTPDRFALSRLRIDSDVALPRFRAILSGAHSGAFGATARVREIRPRAA